ncbi:hypothetical protein MKW98_015241 [Papaver atlanticum]|uniref:Uncharacterized protein n=1 Tax=Papaver atlanticum TaxID=357466 RepID=A0AAD4T514_9MAGN|nr:hypothetical protein MKW98_015241 [Papaver atlanticum]
MGRVKSVLQKLYEEYKLLYPDAKNGVAETSNLHDTEMNDSEDNVGPLLRQRLDKLKVESVEYKSEVDRLISSFRLFYSVNN